MKSNKKKNNDEKKEGSVKLLADLHWFKATESPLQNKKIKAKGVVVSVAQPIGEAKKMAPKIAACFTDIQVVENHPTI